MDDFDRALGPVLAGGGDAETDAAACVLAGAGEGWAPAAASAYQRVAGQAHARGWTDPDLVRMAGRELTGRHHRLAGELARGRDLAAFVTAERLDRFSGATLLVELLRLYARLPRVPALGPGGPAPAAPGGGKVLGRIRALLAKAESTGYPEEAEALTAKAQHLMARHSIDEALAAGAGTGPGARRIGVDRPYEGAKALLLDAVAAANRCESVWSADFGFSTVVGHDSDLEAVDLLYTSLLVQADRALHAGRVSRSRDFRESFLIAYAARIRRRLTEAAGEEESAGARGAPGLLPVLARRDLAVQEETKRLFPATTTSRLKGRDAEGWNHGERAADRARL
nr:DUF2786 domain-containing protein [Streptomyces sp. HPF1205]